MVKEEEEPKYTLAEVAQMQKDNPNNPWLSAASPTYLGPRSNALGAEPQDLTGFQSGIGTPVTGWNPYEEKPKDDKDNTVWQNPSKFSLTPPPEGTTAEPKKEIGLKPGDPNFGLKEIGESPPVGVPEVPTAKPVPKPVPNAVPVAKPGNKPHPDDIAPPKLTIEEQGLASTAQLTQQQQAVKEDRIESLKKQQSLLKTGEDAALKIEAEADTRRKISELELQKMEQEHIVLEAKRRSAQEQQLAELRTTKKDPNHWFKEKGTAGSIVAALSIAAGAFAAGVPHTGLKGQNFAMDIIDKAIARDIDAQQSDIDNKWKSLNYQGDKDQKDYMKDNFIRARKSEATSAAYSHAMALATQARTTANNQSAVVGYDHLINNIKEKQVELAKVDVKHMTDVALKKEHDEQVRAGGGGGGRPIKGDDDDNEVGSVAQRQLGKEIAPLEAMLGGLSESEKDYQKGGALYQSGGLASAARSAIGTTPVISGLVSEESKAADQRFNNLLSQYLKMLSGTAVSDKEFARIKANIMGDGSAAARARGLEIMKQGVTQQIKTYREAAGTKASRNISSGAPPKVTNTEKLDKSKVQLQVNK